MRGAGKKNPPRTRLRSSVYGGVREKTNRFLLSDLIGGRVHGMQKGSGHGVSQ